MGGNGLGRPSGNLGFGASGLVFRPQGSGLGAEGLGLRAVFGGCFPV